MAEIMEPKSISITMFLYYAFLIAQSVYIPYAVHTVPLGYLFLLFAGISLILTLVIIFLMVETKGKTPA